MKILGIHDGHTASAVLIENDQILGMVSEERFTKKKNQGGFPFYSIKWLINNFEIDASKIDHIVFSQLTEPVVEVTSLQRTRHKNLGRISKIFPEKIFTSKHLTDQFIKISHASRMKLKGYDGFFKELGLSKDKVSFIEHHQCHAATAYYLDSNYSYDRKVLVFTLDGSGDGVSGTVSIGHQNKLERIKSIHSFNSLGMLYSRVTVYMGMKPLEHEYKLMGLAPYASNYMMEKSYNVFRKYMRIDKTGLGFQNTSGVYGNEMIDKLKDDLFLHRFDGIAAGLQKLTEELVLEWVLNWVRKTGIKNIAVAGGVFMNVKLNMLINEHTEIDSVFFMPSCGDESLALGAAMVSYYKSNSTETKFKLDHLYLGCEYDEKDIEKYLKSNSRITYKYYDNINEKVNELLKKNKIVGRMKGKMEFGARSLGNRSIISNPKNYEIVSKINRAIKMRDFWMPFAPSILPSGSEKYLVSNKIKKAPFMILGFETKDLAKNEIMAGLHQSDFSCRPQIVEKDINESYHNLISKFESDTGISGILNTSFNVHGYPIVNSPEDAVWTFENSELDVVQIENFLIEKK